ncbi:hypothetical protein MKK55_09850 [Methylobacterium sp. J-059]|uniref:hypothetical protein n=1 Tax=Methylobacterium sp. J-059 TaxID=2836643 RepID=UPI001FBA9638|nr:hypothetical protein [Methylobacterium sp. J-059]MCJ2039242.1 hypothetical protein [Methylobacterium sp. J-059]
MVFLKRLPSKTVATADNETLRTFALNSLLVLRAQERLGGIVSWQSMKSAPRDGQRFVAGLWIEKGAAAQFEMHIIRADMRGKGVHPEDDRGWSWNDYTHWMPLPIPARSGTSDRLALGGKSVTPPMMHRAYGVD